MSADAPTEGHSLLGTDCDDGDAGRNPGQAELCNGVDDDCDERTTFAIGANDGEDDDGDGYPDGACPGVDATIADCDDHNPAVHPNAVERCNGLDDDGDGAVDERCAAPVDMGPATAAATDRTTCSRTAAAPRPSPASWSPTSTAAARTAAPPPVARA